MKPDPDDDGRIAPVIPVRAWTGIGSYYDYERDNPPERKKSSPPDFGPEEPPGRGHGLILGRFAPPHLGHQFALDFARSYAEKLTVLVGSTPEDKIPSELRRDWVREMCPGAEVAVLDLMEHIQPAKSAAYWRLWRDIVRKHVPAGPKYLFSSEGYAERLAQVLGAEVVEVDPWRAAVPISSSKIREDPLAYWAYLPPCVRPHYVRRVCVVGAESTGKSTLAGQLARHYGTVCVGEYARVLLGTRDCGEDDVQRMARGQIASEEALARQASRVMFCDTDLISTWLWSERLFGACPAWIKTQAAERPYDLYLVTATDVPFMGEAVRDEPTERAAFGERCIEELRRLERPFVVIGGTWEERFARACEAVDRELASPRARD